MIVLVVAVVAAGCVSGEPDSGGVGPDGAREARSPYAGEESRWIKALSPQDVEDLRNGRGRGYAKAAELNSYPGPRHVLDLAGELGLTPSQREAVQAEFDAMRADAVPLGVALLEAEAALEKAFATGDVDEERLLRHVAHAATLEGRLRAVHLAAHVATKAILTPQQVEEYDRLRGYAGGGSGDHAHGHG